RNPTEPVRCGGLDSIPTECLRLAPQILKDRSLVMTNVRTKSQVVADDISALFRARNALLWVVTKEEGRVERYLTEAAGNAGYACMTWDAAAGVCDMEGAPKPNIGSPEIDATLDAIKDYRGGRTAWIMRDAPVWLAPPIGINTQRRVRN